MIFFVDRSLGRYDVPRALRSAGYDVVLHDEVFDSATPDVVWLRSVARRRWVVLSKDGRLRYPPERDVIRRVGIHVYVVTSQQLTGRRTAALLVERLPAIEHRVARSRPGYVVGIYQDRPGLRWLVQPLTRRTP